MKKSIIALILIVFSLPSLADSLTATLGSHLVNAQIIRHTQIRGDTYNTASIGYYYFDGNGTVKHYRLEYLPSNRYDSTKLSAKHINVSINNLYNYDGYPHDLVQDCTQADMGQIRKPTSTTTTNYGTYSYDGSQITMVIDGATIIWNNVNDSSDPDRWEPSSFHGNTLHNIITNYYAFGYFSNGIGPYPINFKKDFNQGNNRSSTTGYYGKLYSNSGAQSPNVWPVYVGEFKLHMKNTTNIDKDNNLHTGVYSNIWYYDLSTQKGIDDANRMTNDLDISKGLMVQSSFVTNYYAQFPTLLFENTGHMFHGFTKQRYAAESIDAFESRHCWTDSDTHRTKGHTRVHLGAWNNNTVSHIVNLEVSKNNRYPYLSIGYGHSHD